MKRSPLVAAIALGPFGIAAWLVLVAIVVPGDGLAAHLYVAALAAAGVGVSAVLVVVVADIHARRRPPPLHVTIAADTEPCQRSAASAIAALAEAGLLDLVALQDAINRHPTTVVYDRDPADESKPSLWEQEHARLSELVGGHLSELTTDVAYRQRYLG